MGNQPFFVAELSGNHNGNLENARDLVNAAAIAGADAIKLQTYKPETMTLPGTKFSVSKSHELWGGLELFELYRTAMTPWEWHEELFQLARSLGIEAFSSPFDRSAVDFLEDLECQRYKIASLETGDTDLISYVASTGKPMIMSTGASNLDEIDMAVSTARNSGCKDLTLLVCTSSYPAKAKDANLLRMQILKQEFDTPIGVSDHTLGIGVSIAAIALGATVVEKHFTLSREQHGPDSRFSLEPNEFSSLVREGRDAFSSLGSPAWRMQESEAESRRLRRSLYVAVDVKVGEVATRQNIKPLRPNSGGPIQDIESILGKKFRRDYPAGTPATQEIVQS